MISLSNSLVLSLMKMERVVLLWLDNFSILVTSISGYPSIATQALQTLCQKDPFSNAWWMLNQLIRHNTKNLCIGGMHVMVQLYQLICLVMSCDFQMPMTLLPNLELCIPNTFMFAQEITMSISRLLQLLALQPLEKSLSKNGKYHEMVPLLISKMVSAPSTNHWT